eukprot:TRINITY_DN5855_c0_g1_i1.p1 TRINITY_DN5855_c0_g1~~TRINITY_DN5855_c0_g1_i1.p1  ORF type:complete len:300 (+),score=47.74 TRINITY_DN5855_c0_g1_i1:52-951(+)
MNVVRRSALRFLYSTAGRTYYRCALNRNKAPLRYLQISRYNVSRITYAQDDDDDNTTNEDIHLDYLDEASEEGMMDENIGEELGDDDLDIDHEALLAEYPELEELVVGEDSELTPEQIAARNLNQARYWDPWYWLLDDKAEEKAKRIKKTEEYKAFLQEEIELSPQREEILFTKYLGSQPRPEKKQGFWYQPMSVPLDETDYPLPYVRVPTPRNGETIESFLTKIGKECVQHVKKFPSWEALFTYKTLKLKKIGIRNCKQRKWILNWVEKYRQGVEPGSQKNFHYFDRQRAGYRFGNKK